MRIEVRVGLVVELHHVGVVVAGVVERFADGAGVDSLAELDAQLGAAAEIDAPVEHVAAGLEHVGVQREHQQREQHQDDGCADPVALLADEIDVRPRLDDLEELLVGRHRASPRSKGGRGGAAAADHEVEHPARDPHRGEEVGGDADQQGDGEAADGPEP
jgi:hypothetical protein